MKRGFQSLPAVLLVAVAGAAFDHTLDAQPATPFRSVSSEQQSPQFRADSPLVLIHVTVTDRLGRVVTALGRENFQLLENDRSQEVKYFSTEEAPLSIALVVDVSNSMTERMGALRQAVAAFLNAANPEDEFCLIELADRAQVAAGFTSSRAAIEERLAQAQPQGQTALLDGMYLALQEMKQGRYARKALLVISDGGDNHSRFYAKEVRNWALESDAPIYAIETYRPTSTWVPEPNQMLTGLAGQTGGRSYIVDNPSEAAQSAEKIGRELRSQYVLGFVPSNLERDGKYHRVRVKLVAPAGQPTSGQTKLWADWRRGYYAPEDRIDVRPTARP